MHKFIEWIFASFLNIEKFLRVLCVFFIMLMSLYWIQNLIGASWWWMGFIAPFLDYILDLVNGIYSFSFDFSGKTIEIKYFNAVVLMVIFIFGLKGISICIEKLHEMYENAHFLYKKTNENVFNAKLHNDVKNEEKQTNNYQLYFNTRIPKRYSNRIVDINLTEENKKIQDILNKITKTFPVKKQNGFLYNLNDFEKIDTVLKTLFNIKESYEYIDFIICIQIGNDFRQLNKLINLEEWGKIIIAADTLCRYEFNDIKNFTTSNVGIFQRENNTLEVHEFVNKM